MSKLGGGLKSGIRQQDLTRRLDDNLSSSDFERARRGTRFRKHIKSAAEYTFYAVIVVALLFCFVRFTVQNFFPNKIHTVLAPILGKNSAVVEQALTGKSEDDMKDTDDTDLDDNDKTADKQQTAQNQAKKSQSKSSTNSKHNRHHSHHKPPQHQS
jgi:hypothetical protein